jgi:hypothetical protein
MRKVIASPLPSRDGFLSGPQGESEWSAPYLDEEMAGWSRDTWKIWIPCSWDGWTYE